MPTNDDEQYRMLRDVLGQVLGEEAVEYVEALLRDGYPGRVKAVADILGTVTGNGGGRIDEHVEQAKCGHFVGIIFVYDKYEHVQLGLIGECNETPEEARAQTRRVVDVCKYLIGYMPGVTAVDMSDAQHIQTGDYPGARMN